MFIDGKVLTGAGVAFLWQVVMHWLPWDMFFGKHVNAHRFVSYTLGVVGILLGMLVVDAGMALMGFGLAVAAGAGTGLSYVIRMAGEWRQEMMARRIREEA